MKNWADAMIRELDQSRTDNEHIGLVRRYLAGRHDMPYMPPDATAEYQALARQSVTNWLPLIAGTFTESLYVDGYRSGRSADNVAGWKRWQDNKLDARQMITMRGAIEYGVSYVAVEGSKIRTLSARKSWAWYEDDEAEHPVAGIVEVGSRIASDGTVLARYEFWHDRVVYTYERVTGRRLGVPDDPSSPHDGKDVQIGSLELVNTRKLASAVPVPWVRFRDRLDDEAQGVIRPLISLQNRVNASVFYLLMALHYASFRQRWATGLVIPRDEQEMLPDGTENPNFGKPIEPFKAAVNRLWISENGDSKFGDFDQTDVTGHLAAIASAVGTLISIGRSSPLLASGNSISNVAIESIAALNASMNSQIDSFKMNFGESWEAVLALSGASDPSARVRWRDTEPRSFSQIVDGLVKLHQMGAPAEGLFELVPQITDQQLEQWRELAAKPSDTDRLADAIARQAAPAVGADVPAAE
ncbi:phage portal protein [Actinomadura fulvescens]|uniref:Portal protein n=1 Tax=Actinomadura fulvescens TaxID=46160 RepID=A0ABN3Q1U8_9ACTN